VFKKWLFLLPIISILVLSGCSYYDRIQEDFYVTDIWGDDAEFNTLTVNGEATFNDQVILSGDGEVWIEFRPGLDFESVRANGAPTWITRGVFGAFSLPVAGAGEILTIGMCVPNRWSKPAWTFLQDVGDQPRGMAVYEGKLYIPCSADDNVWVYDGTTFSISGAVDRNPRYSCVYDDNLYVTCRTDDSVWVFDGLTWAKSGDVGEHPEGMAVFEGDLYVACEGDDEIWRLSGGVWTVDPALGAGGVAGAVGSTPNYLAEYDGDLYVGCRGADDDVWIRSGGAWAKDDDVGDDPAEFHEHDGDLYLNCEGDDITWVKSGGAWAVSTNIETTQDNQPIGLEEYNGDLFSACQQSVWSDIMGFWNMNSDFNKITADAPMFLKEYNGKLYCSCENGDGIWVYEGETAQIHIHCWITDAQGAATDAFRLQLEYENVTVGTDVVPTTGDTAIIEVLTGVAPAYQSYGIQFPLDMTGVEVGDNIGIVIDRIASPDEIAGEVAIQHIGLVFKCDKLGNTTPF